MSADGSQKKKPKELVVISGKGGTGKTSITASFAVLSKEGALAILGLVPLAGWISADIAGEGLEMRAPLAISVIFGLAVSTLLTLVLIPVLYEFIEKIISFKHFTKKKLK